MENNSVMYKTLASIPVVVASLLAVVTGVYAIVKPMGQRIDALVTDIEYVQAELVKHEEIPIHIGAAGDLAKLQAGFVEAETQFREGKNAVNIKFQEYERLLAMLWEKVMDMRFPDTDYWPHVSGGEE